MRWTNLTAYTGLDHMRCVVHKGRRPIMSFTCTMDGMAEQPYCVECMRKVAQREIAAAETLVATVEEIIADVKGDHRYD